MFKNSEYSNWNLPWKQSKLKLSEGGKFRNVNNPVSLIRKFSTHGISILKKKIASILGLKKKNKHQKQNKISLFTSKAIERE